MMTLIMIVAFCVLMMLAVPVGYALIIAGAIGNLVDRLLFGYVIDYVLFYTATWSFAVFNLADSFITIGAGLVILDELLGFGREDTRPSND